MKNLFIVLLIALALVACGEDSPTGPTRTVIDVYRPPCCVEYFIGENIPIKWNAGPVAPVSINLVPADRSSRLPQYRIFTNITKREVLFRDWWDLPNFDVSPPDGPYVFVLFYELQGVHGEGTSNVFHLRHEMR